ncbi:MAG: two-component regulator propeller domain-containing protein [Melioribacteraceae bacterium]
MRSNFTIRFGGIALCILLFVSCERDVFTGYNEPAEIENCKIFISSDPSKASIYLNGMNTGQQTPDTLIWVKPGINKVTLKTNYYEDTTATVDVAANRISYLNIIFEANSRGFGKINCTSTPEGAEIFLDDIPINKNTPFVIKDVKPGSHYVKYKYASHRESNVFVNVNSNSIESAYAVLEDTTKWVSFNVINSPILSNTINSLAVDHRNNLWIGTIRGLCKKSGDKWTYYTTSNTILQDNTINHIAVDSSDGVWLSTPTGVYLLKNSVIANYSYNLTNKNINMIACSRNGEIWAVARGVGLCKLVGSKWVIYNASNSGLKTNNINCIVIDKDGYVWIGYSYSSVSVFNGSSWSTYTGSPTNIYSMHIIEDGYIWAGTTNANGNGQVFSFDQENWVLLNELKLMNNLTHTISSSANMVFFATTNGVGIFNTTTKRLAFYNRGNSELQLFRVQALALDLDGNLWVGTVLNGCGVLKKNYLMD